MDYEEDTHEKLQKPNMMPNSENFLVVTYVQWYVNMLCLGLCGQEAYITI